LIEKISEQDKKRARELVAGLKAKHEAGREALLRDELETIRWKDQLYYDTLDALDPEPLQAGLKGILKIKANYDWREDNS
jgi:hypothetical protein